MTTLTQITERLSVSPQIAAADLPALAAAGFRVILCNRPDGEEPGQPAFAAIAAAARSAGMEAVHIPIRPGEARPADVAAFGAAVDGAQGKVLAYCRSGARARHLWSLAEAGRGTNARAGG